MVRWATALAQHAATRNHNVADLSADEITNISQKRSRIRTSMYYLAEAFTECYFVYLYLYVISKMFENFSVLD